MLLALALACAPKLINQTRSEPAPVPDATAVGLAPKVHTLEQLRASMPVGTVIRLRIREAGQADTEQRWEVTEADQEGVRIASMVYAADGATLISDEGAAWSAWSELHSHADFPADRTVREASSIEVPAGRFDTWLYTVVGTEEEGGRDFVRGFHFARALPGPPVSYTIQQGKGIVFEMTLMERTPGGAIYRQHVSP